MRTFEVQTTRFLKKYASVTVEAENEKQAIKKARSIEQEEFEEVETHEHTSWEVKKPPWYISLFLGR